MEAASVDELPTGGGWQYEPKYDGFRCLAHRRGARVHLQLRNGKPLERCFPEVAEGLGAIPDESFVLDGELVVPGGGFEALQLRPHPAESRIQRLARETPAEYVAFDLLARAGIAMLKRPLSDGRRELEAFIAASRDAGRSASGTRPAAWQRRGAGSAGRGSTASSPSGSIWATAPASGSCRSSSSGRPSIAWSGGLYRKGDNGKIEPLLLGLYDADGRLNYVGRARVGSDAAEIEGRLEPLVGGSGFTGRAPGGKNRWSGKERKPVPLDPALVVEVSADHITGGFMPQGARLLRWRSDRPPERCTMDQIG
jgi:ATP-dependent DNA ligase